MGWIYPTISESVIGQVVGCQSSCDVWSRLYRIYCQQSIARALQLRNQLQAIKKGSDSKSDFVFKIKNIGDALIVVGEEVKDRDLVICLVNGVGHDFDAIVDVITTQRYISFEDAQYLLMVHEQRLEHLNSSSYLDIGIASAHLASNNF
ncbi:hypothetical protein Ddye_005769 [Dipteronia dyeriana]|uniref:Uncharacterized protein n=1 Tax=Dipteronia dyeriana TaxID=168575 RepID=A0AAD9XGR1_9ROSI|nr:hypothetical protein Ddye_005769 [Dipteronia dyeriana]